MLVTILFATFLSSIVSLIGAFLLSRRNHWSNQFALHLTALSSGVLLSTALLHLAPEAIHLSHESEMSVFYAIFAAIVSFFLLERLLLWYHHHHDAHDIKPTAWLITIGDTLHNFIDGVAIAAALMLDPTLGLITVIAVGAHEIPQEIADFAVMVTNGMSKKRALLLNAVSALSSLLGAVLMFALRDSLEAYLPLVMAFSAGMFLYISLSDLIPELHQAHQSSTKDRWLQIVWFAVGVGLLLGIGQLIGHSHADNHEEHDEHETETVDINPADTDTHFPASELVSN